MRLSGKRALVTGSSRGIGAEIATLFAREGASVVVNYRSSRKDAESVARKISRFGGKAFVVGGDVSDPESVRSMFATVSEELGGLDVLVNNAGLADPSVWAPRLDRITLEMWRRVFAVDAFGTFLYTQAATKLLGRGSSVINVGSTPVLSGDKEGLVYASAKGAVVAMTKMLAQTLAPKTRVNCMLFGSFKTTWVDWLTPAQAKGYEDAIPMKRFGRPADAANLALFLASDDSSFITGQSLVVDGGEVMR